MYRSFSNITSAMAHTSSCNKWIHTILLVLILWCSMKPVTPFLPFRLLSDSSGYQNRHSCQLLVATTDAFVTSSSVSPSPQLTAKHRLALMRKETIVGFNTQQYDFQVAVESILQQHCHQVGTNSPITAVESLLPLESLHSFSEGQSELKRIASSVVIDKSGARVSKLQIRWNMDRGRLTPECAQLYANFDEIYRCFVRDVIAPRLGGGRILYQRAPTLRVSFPSSKPTSELHNDEDYHHQPSEINFWMPLTTVSGNNSLWVESEPYKGDWHSLEMHYGELCQFYGNQCRHYTVPNDTNVTRVSIDFRAVSDASGGHDPTFHKGTPRGSKAKFQKVYDVGGYYSVIETAKS